MYTKCCWRSTAETITLHSYEYNSSFHGNPKEKPDNNLKFL